LVFADPCSEVDGFRIGRFCLAALFSVDDNNYTTLRFSFASSGV